MTDTGQVPGEGLPEDAGTAEPPGVPAPGAYTYLDPADATAEEDEILLMPGAQGAWGQPQAQAADQSHSQGQGQQYAQAQAQPRRPLHMGPAVPDTNGSPVRTLADRGPAPQAPMPTRQSGPPTTGPEYLDIPPQGAAPWQPAQAPQGTAPAETVAPQHAQPETPAHAQEFAQVGAEPMPVGAYAGQAPYAAHEHGQGGYEHAQHGYTEQPAADQTLGQFVPVDGIVPTTPHLAPTPPQAMVVPPLPEEQDVAAEQPSVPGQQDGADRQGPGGGVQDVSAQSADTGRQDAAGEQAAAARPETDAEQGARSGAGQEGAAEWTGADQQEVPAEQGGTSVEQPAPGAADQQVPADQQVLADQVAVGGQQSGGGQQVLADQLSAGDRQAVADQQVLADQMAGGGQQVPADQHVAGEHVAVADQQSLAGQQGVADQHSVGGQQVLADPHVAGEHAAVADQQSLAGQQGVADQQSAAGQQLPADPQTAADQQVVDGQQAVVDGAVAGSQSGADPQSAAGPQPVAGQQLPVDQQATADQQAATGQQPLVDPQAAAEHQAATGQQLPADQQAVGDQQGAVDAAVAGPESAADPQSAAGQQPVAGQQLPADQQVATGQQPLADPQAAADQQVATGQQLPADQQSAADPHAAVGPGQQDAPGQQAAHPVTDPQDPHAMANQQSAEQAPAGDASFAPENVAEWDTPGPESAGLPPQGAASPDGAASVPAPRGGDSGAIPLPESADTEDPAEQTVAPAELTGEPEHLTPEAETAEPHPAAPGYDDTEREAVLRVMRERRDIRNGFRSDPIPHEVLLRVLEAAHTAPSVGHSQPWDFVVIRSADTRRAMHELAMRQKDAYAKSLPKGRAKQFKELKIEAILDTPVNIVVTADPTRGGRHTLGRHTQPQMAPYSSALAVENLWLAARAEGLGVGWVSFFDEREMVRSLGLPEHLEVVAYLCVGYVDEFPEEPELMQAGWSKRRPLSWVVHEETYGRRALPGEDPHDLLAETVSNIRPLDAKALGEAWERQKRMTKPPGALGMLEIISAQLSGLSRVCPPPIPEPAAVAIFAGDHGVHAQGVTPWPQEVTGQMVANFLGGGAVCNAFASQVGAEVCVIDVGVAGELPATPGLLPRKVRAGTADMTTGPALTREEVKEAIEVGIETARDLVAAGNKALLTGEMGIANTTASAALISVYTEVDPAEVTGRGTGINDETHARKVEVVRRALDLHKPDPADPIGVLAAVGGLEHAAMVGLLLGGASLRTPVILDGVSAGAAALVARAIAPEVLAACIAGHRSAEPGHVAALNKLGLRPLVDLDLRLGEGTGALLALPIVQSAARAMHEVATFDSAGVTEK
ncbi:nicotinate-nucleotide--dimethylbenzimidazole phosphoribosyltransferase [Streptomyces sp. BH097]|uniref:nicotinate-nucleotide--dimethylbenzimidazole phosphoribosyltransferase n=1 Tax=unclassified Streptomyces TaxID=2593676 RepID=UPI003BB5C3E5